MPDPQLITITDTSVNTVTVPRHDTVQWKNSAAVAVTLSSLHGILRHMGAGDTIELSVGQTSSAYTVNGSRGSHTYTISPTSAEGLPKTGTIDIG